MYKVKCKLRAAAQIPAAVRTASDTYFRKDLSISLPQDSWKPTSDQGRRHAGRVPALAFAPISKVS